jgi:hypothetical protein
MSDPKGPLMAPGAYSAQLVRVGPAAIEALGVARNFELQALTNLPEGTDYLASVAFQREVSDAQRQLYAVDAALKEVTAGTQYLRAAIDASPQSPSSLQQAIDTLEADVAELKFMLRGNPARQRLSEAMSHSAAHRIGSAANALNTRMPPTANQREDLRLGSEWMTDIVARVAALREGQLADIKKTLAENGAPWVPGQSLND